MASLAVSLTASLPKTALPISASNIVALPATGMANNEPAA